jgi:hypothetical protein
MDYFYFQSVFIKLMVLVHNVIHVMLSMAGKVIDIQDMLHQSIVIKLMMIQYITI